MKHFKNQFAQGDVFFIRVPHLPKDVKKIKPQNDQVIVAHSETGHHHVMDAKHTTMYRLPEELYECFLVVDEHGDVLKHLRDFDTHESVRFEPGIYKAFNQLEYTPEGLRPVAD